jgi:hypothetical protein
MGDVGVEQWWNDTDSGKENNAEKNLPRTNLTFTCLGLNQGLRSVIEATDGTAQGTEWQEEETKE